MHTAAFVTPNPTRLAARAARPGPGPRPTVTRPTGGRAPRPSPTAVHAASASAAPTDEERLSAQVREGRVKSVDAKTAGALQKEGWVILDVRPPFEVAKAGVAGAVAVPVYVEEGFDSPASYLKHASWFGMGGWWLGGAHMKPNPDFMAGVMDRIPPQGSRVVVACQKGLRSLAAAEQLARAGYGDLAWINGGLDSAAPGDLCVVGAPDLRYGGIGGLSEALGMTDVQREQAAGASAAGGSGGAGGGPSRTLMYGALALLAADGAWFLATTGRELLARAGGGQ